MPTLAVTIISLVVGTDICRPAIRSGLHDEALKVYCKGLALSHKEQYEFLQTRNWEINNAVIVSIHTTGYPILLLKKGLTADPR